MFVARARRTYLQVPDTLRRGVTLLIAGLKRHGGERCGLTDWQGAAISLEPHHVNKDGDEDRLANLRLLCPNCHSEIDTWGGRKRARHRIAA